jgi:hypothetical protein
VVRAAALGLALAVAACGSFEDPAIVIDLRPLAAVAEPPEQVVVIDPANPLAIELADVRVCALYADPERRVLDWQMTLCPPKRDMRCDQVDAPSLPATLEPTPTAITEVSQVACGVIPAGPGLTAIVRRTFEDDSLQGFGGVDVNLLVRAVPRGAGEEQAVYLGKQIRFSAKVPAERVANTNPAVDELTAQIDRGAGLETPIALPRGGCTDGGPRTEVPVGAELKLTPVPRPGSFETYVVPTFEGGSRTFTENLRYQWLATGGDFSRGDTGGPRDPAGNPAVIDTEWRTGELPDGVARRAIDLWVVQRDERGGASWWTTCVEVVR